MTYDKTQSVDLVDVEIRAPVRTQVLSVLRSLTNSLSHHVGFDDEQSAQIEMAVDEACANVVRHAYKHVGVSPDLPPEKFDSERAKQCVLHLKATLGEDYLKISIIDEGIGLDKTPKGCSTIDEFHERGARGGLGIYIIQNFMDSVEYDSPPGSGTILTMTKHLTPARVEAE